MEHWQLTALGLGAVLFMGLMAALAAVDVDSITQLWLTVPFLGAIVLLRSLYVRGRWSASLRLMLRILAITAGVYVTLRYVFWRGQHTLAYDDLASFVAGWSLFLAELYGIALYLLGLFVSVQPLRRDPQPLPADRRTWPTVDVFITTCDEAPPLLETTILAAHAIDYPPDKLRVYLLDDGATQARLTHRNPQIREAARRRRAVLSQLCERTGTRYLNRADNRFAKAGNMNAALARSDGDLILILDADHVPTVDILLQTVGWFCRDPKLFLVQTPHFFVTPDPLERNLATFQRMPSENEMFYSVVQRGLDFWNSAIFCGSAAVLRREPLVRHGGFCTGSLTEDAETSVKLHSHGYRSAYLRLPLVSGLQPGTFADFVRQRVRWAQGMTQIFLTRNPLWQRGLKPWQRLGYLSALLFWFFGFARLIFVLAPSAYLLFGLKIYDAALPEILAYTLPHLLASWLVTDMLFGKFRWPFVSELYEYMLAVFTTRAVAQTLLNVRAPRFVVTPKQVCVESDAVSHLARPFYLLLLIALVTLGFGVYRLQAFPEELDSIVINLVWEGFNFIVLLGALGALLERRQRRWMPRLNVNLLAHLSGDAGQCLGALRDVSLRGARLVTTPRAGIRLRPGENIQVRVFNGVTGRPVLLNARVQGQRCRPCAQQGFIEQGIVFTPWDLYEKQQLVILLYGSSRRWRNDLAGRDRYIGLLGGIGLLLAKGAIHTVRHLHWVVWHGAGDLLRGPQAWLSWNGRRKVIVRSKT